MFLIFDTETTGLPRNYNAPLNDFDNWPRLVQLAWLLCDEGGKIVSSGNYLIKPRGFNIPYNAEKIHGITTEMAENEGEEIEKVLDLFEHATEKSQYIAGHNIEFDLSIMGSELLRLKRPDLFEDLKIVDTKEVATSYCAIPGGKGGGFKWPTLAELHDRLFSQSFDSAHNAAADVAATARCFFELMRLSVIDEGILSLPEKYFLDFAEKNSGPIPAFTAETRSKELRIEPEQEGISADDETGEKKNDPQVMDKSDSKLPDIKFCHLHCHSHFSILQATSEIGHLVSKAVEYKMPALALTDKGNMYGAFKFHNEAVQRGIKPIIGCEFYLCDDHTDKKRKENGFAQVVLAKNKNGYSNLCKLNALAFLDGFYYVPRIDKRILKNHKANLIALSSGLRGEIPQLLLNHGDKYAEEAFQWWAGEFEGDFYVELVRHGLKEEEIVNEFLLEMAKRYNVKVIAANNVFYVDKEDANAHDILMCVKDGELQKTPIGKGRSFRYGFPNDEYFFKSGKEMASLFQDRPEALENTLDIADKIEVYELKREVLLPAFPTPPEFGSEDDYLRHLAYEGAEHRYGEITKEIKDRLDFELETIRKTGYPGYFLIVQDITSEARKMYVSVGPGRGSAAGSVVAYCIGITNVDPIKYDLLFERFLNPDRISLPDIDIDFDDEGRSKVIDFVVKKYGKSQVAQIITYGSMAAKSAIRDTARVLDLPLNEADRLAKLMPDYSLHKLLQTDEKELGDRLSNDQLNKAVQIKKIAQGKDLLADTLRQAAILEGSLRNTGTHACGLIITPMDMTELIPVASAKDTDLMVTQYDNSVIESAGMLKMDFLGLKTLSIIRDSIEIIRERHDVEIDPETIPLDDKKTYGLYQRGETNGTFQFESAGMQKHLKALKPDKFEDLIAMNALYRPGPMEYIPNFIDRKRGREKISYDIPEMEEFLNETYGITVYQEQVMLLSQKLAGFSKGDADVLRKAMGKKIFKMLEELKPKFLDGCEKNGHDRRIAEKVWKDWQSFAAYAFNKSHSTCYSVIAFQTAYLKANYTGEYMAAVLTNNMSDIKKVAFFMEECKRLGLKVLGPDVNESVNKFTVNRNGEIRFGLGAVKGVGEAAVENIVETRKTQPFKSVFDLAKRVDLRAVNKKTLESLALSGAFDSFENSHRAQYFATDGNGRSSIECAIRHANELKNRENQAQINIFGDAEGGNIPEPELPDIREWNALEVLAREREVVGIYISGHPLDDFQLEIENFCNCGLGALNHMDQYLDRDLKMAGMVTDSAHRTSKKGKPFGILNLEDYTDNARLMLFSDDYVKFKDYLVPGWKLFLQGKVQLHPFREGELDFKISRIELLSDLRDKMAKSVTINISKEKVNESVIEKLMKLSKTHSGHCQLRLNLIDDENQEILPLISRSKKVRISDEFLAEMSEIKEINYTIN